MGMSWGVLGLSWAVLGLSWAILALSWACLGPSWHPLGPSESHLEPLGQDPENDSKCLLCCLGPDDDGVDDDVHFWDHFGVISGFFSGPFLGSIPDQFLAPFWLHFGSLLAPF